jgi:hypothetical protein
MRSSVWCIMPSGKMCTHECLRLRYADGAGNVSCPFVENVRCPPLNGSTRSGLLSDDAGVLGAVRSSKNGPRERSRIACVMVGWKRPPNGEWAVRCVGSTCPNVKNVEMPLYSVNRRSIRDIQRVLVREAQVVASQSPAQVVRIEQVAKREYAPQYRVVHTTRRE